MSEHNFLVFTKRQTTFITAGTIFIAVMIFTLGYVIGQKRALNDFSDQVKEDSFADKVKFSMYSSYKSLPTNIDIDTEAELDLEAEKNLPQETKEQIESQVESEAQETSELAGQLVTGKKYWAQLCGFSSPMAAKKFAERAKKLDIPVEIVEKKSRGKSKTITWYQAVTPKYQNKQELLKNVEKIQLAEKLQKVKLIEE